MFREEIRKNYCIESLDDFSEGTNRIKFQQQTISSIVFECVFYNLAIS